MPGSPLGRFFSEHHRHEKIALMLRQGEKDAEPDRDKIAGRHVCDQKWRALENCSHSHQHEYAPVRGITGGTGANPHSKPLSPPFRPHLEVDGGDNMAVDEGEDASLEAIRIAARIK